MNVGIYQNAASLSSLERWQQVVAQNITSGEQPAYKRRVASFSGEDRGEFLADPKARIDRGEGEPAVFPVAHASISFRPGEIQTTRRNLDVAIQGAGFFELKMPDGSKAYTRDGSFHLRADRTLATAQGGTVLNATGMPIQLLPGRGDLSINQDGTLSQGDTTLGRIAIQNFDDPAKLTALADGLFAAPPDVTPSPMAKPVVLQGNLEASNAPSLYEMVDLVTISRAYEANQKVITSRDDLMDKTLQAFG